MMTDARKALESAREALDTVVRFTGNNHCKMQTVAADEALAALGDDAAEALAAIDAALASGEQRQKQDVLWLPIAGADKSIATVQTFGDVTLRNSYPVWVRDEDGRTYEAVWNAHKDGYWWDLEAESPVDPVEFAPHPLAIAAPPAPETRT